MVFEAGGAGDDFEVSGSAVVIKAGVTGVVIEEAGTGVVIEVGETAVAFISGSSSGIAGSIRLSATVAEVTCIGPSTASSSSTLGS